MFLRGGWACSEADLEFQKGGADSRADSSRGDTEKFLSGHLQRCVYES